MSSYGKIVLSAEIYLLPKINLDETPSKIHGLDRQDEKDLRIIGCELIQTSGILLRLPQVAMATGQTLFQRFYYAKSFIRYDMEIIAMSCIFLASKIEENPRMIHDVLNVFHHIKQVRGQKIILPLNFDKSYTDLKERVINAECLILKVLGFCVHVKQQPHKLILMYLQVLGLEKNKKLMQCAWNYMNDSLRTDVSLRYQPETIACACIYLSARKIGLPLPSSPSWFSIFKVTENDIIDICYRILEQYHRPKPNFEQLELTVKKLKTLYDASRTQRYLEPKIPISIASNTSTSTIDRIGRIISTAVPIIIESKQVTTTKRSYSRLSSDNKKKSRDYTRSPPSSPNKHKRRLGDSRTGRYTRDRYSPERNKFNNRCNGRDRRSVREQDRDRRRNNSRDRRQRGCYSNDRYSMAIRKDKKL